MPLPSTYKDNTGSALPKNDYGIKISKAGFDATTAADNDLLFNSSWPSVQIVRVIVLDSPSTKQAIAHNLGFPPVAFYMGNGSLRGCVVDKNYVYTEEGLTDKKVVVYNIDISKDIEYPYTAKSNITASYDPNYGIKMVKEGDDIESDDLRDYILHSRCGSPLILAVKTQETSNSANTNVVQYTSKIGYPTFNFGYVGINAGDTIVGTILPVGEQAYMFAPQGGQSYPIAFTDGFTVYVELLNNVRFNGKGSVICLRSPMFATTNTVQVTY